MSHFIRRNGKSPILVHLPHNSIYLPDDFVYQRSKVEKERDIHVLVDHHTDRLFAPLGGTSFVNPYCRLYFDPERFADPAQEEMSQIGMGVFYTHTVDGHRFRMDDSSSEYQSRLDSLYYPYHHQLTDCCYDLMERYGHCVLIDGHSYPKRCFPFERFQNDDRPEIDIGTDPIHTPDWLKQLLYQSFSEAGYSVSFDQPFKGTLVPLSLNGQERLLACMIEVRRDVYLDQDAYEEGLVLIDAVQIKRFHFVLGKVREKVISYLDSY